jgi:catechol 2,3-dioxygenase-like lactoylglutathione lyase family enzyme
MELTGPASLNHVAYPTWDSAATYRFYTEVLRCPFVAAIQLDEVPSNGAATPFLHTFYALSNGGCVAFFEVDGLTPAADDGVPSWIRHLALDVESVESLTQWRQHFLDHGVEPVGIVDHDGTWISLYVFDPNGVRIELTVQTRPLTESDRTEGLAALSDWCTARGQGLDLDDVRA